MRELPEDFPDGVRQAWKLRRKQEIRNASEAIIEAANFAKINGIDVDKELVALLRLTADAQYCADEPTRCTRKIQMGSASKSIKASNAAASPVEIRVTAAQRVQPARTKKKRRGCCGK